MKTQAGLWYKITGSQLSSLNTPINQTKQLMTACQRSYISMNSEHFKEKVSFGHSFLVRVVNLNIF